MGVPVEQAAQLSLEQIEKFLEGREELEVRLGSRGERYELVSGVLGRHRYRGLGRREKGLVRRYLRKLTGYSPAQLSRLIGERLGSGELWPRPYRRRRFPRRYRRAEARLLARVDRAHEQLSGPATKRILEREWEEHGEAQYERLAGISVSHLYNLRGSKAYRGERRLQGRTKRVVSPYGERRRQEAGGEAGYVQVDTVHSTERYGSKGAYTINMVDAVTQWQQLRCREQISENWLQPVLESMLESFPFRVQGFRSDNGSEFVNGRTAGMLEKLRVEFTNSRARRSNDNARVESKNGSVVRKWMTYAFQPKGATREIDEFYRQWLNPYVNLHRPSGFGRMKPDRKGRLRLVYDCWRTPLEALAALPRGSRNLRSGVTLAGLREQARELFGDGVCRAHAGAAAAAAGPLRGPGRRLLSGAGPPPEYRKSLGRGDLRAQRRHLRRPGPAGGPGGGGPWGFRPSRDGGKGEQGAGGVGAGRVLGLLLIARPQHEHLSHGIASGCHAQRGAPMHAAAGGEALCRHRCATTWRSQVPEPRCGGCGPCEHRPLASRRSGSAGNDRTGSAGHGASCRLRPQGNRNARSAARSWAGR